MIMLDFSSLLSVWGSADFDCHFKTMLEQLDHAQLPLQQALAYTSYPSDEPIRVVVISAESDSSTIHVRAMIFYSGIIAGCSCADDPTPVEAQAESCTVLVDIDHQSGTATISLLS